MRYNKLVRNKIIEIIKKDGVKPSYHIATSADYLIKLKEKLLEEVGEFNEAESLEEMADIFEVIYAILTEKGWNVEQVVALQKKKREDRGGFEKKIILEDA